MMVTYTKSCRHCNGLVGPRYLVAYKEHLAGQNKVRESYLEILKSTTTKCTYPLCLKVGHKTKDIGGSIASFFFRWTLDQYSVNADTVIHFTPMHKTLR